MDALHFVNDESTWLELVAQTVRLTLNRQPGVTLPVWTAPYLLPARNKSVSGGRLATKTSSLAQIAVLRLAGLLPDYEPEPVRLACARQFQVSIRESNKRLVETTIESMGLADQFEARPEYLRNRRTGGVMVFPAFTRAPESFGLGCGPDAAAALLDGLPAGTTVLEALDVLWVEEAHTLRDEMQIIGPSVRRFGAELWFSWNPTRTDDWCWRRFVLNAQDDDVCVHVTVHDNRWLRPEWERDRDELERTEPDRYPHVYLGFPTDPAPAAMLSRLLHLGRRGGHHAAP